MGTPDAVNSNPSTAFKAKDFDLMTQSQDTGPVWRQSSPPTLMADAGGDHCL
jgi:hypothetical protein